MLDALLAWLYARDLDDEPTPGLSAFTQTKYCHFYGDPFTEAEVAKASRRLAEEGFIKGPGGLGGGILRPRITATGIKMARSRRSVSDDHPIPAPSIVTTITGDHNTVQTASPDASIQITTITHEHREQARRIADELEQALPVLQGVTPDAGAMPGELRRVADQDDPGVMADACANGSGGDDRRDRQRSRWHDLPAPPRAARRSRPRLTERSP